MSRSGKRNNKMAKPFLSVICRNNLSPQSLSSSLTVPLTFVTFTLVDNPSQKSMVVHYNEKLKFQICFLNKDKLTLGDNSTKISLDRNLVSGVSRLSK